MRITPVVPSSPMTAREDARLDDILAAVTAETNDDTAALAALAREIKAALRVPTFGLILGERVQIEGVELPNARRGYPFGETRG